MVAMCSVEPRDSHQDVAAMDIFLSGYSRSLCRRNAHTTRPSHVCPLVCLAVMASLTPVACTTGGNRSMDEVEVLMRRYDGAVPGASLLVLSNGVPLVRRSQGFADLERRVRATPQTNYRLASVTKQFTAAAILL